LRNYRSFAKGLVHSDTFNENLITGCVRHNIKPDCMVVVRAITILPKAVALLPARYLWCSIQIIPCRRSKSKS